MNAQNTSPGTVARAKSSAALVRSNNVSLSPRRTLRISLEHPPGPGELPEGTLRKHSANRLVSRRNSRSGTKSRTSTGICWCLFLWPPACQAHPTLTRLEVPKLLLSALGGPWTLALAAHDSELPFPVAPVPEPSKLADWVVVEARCRPALWIRSVHNPLAKSSTRCANSLRPIEPVPKGL